ncbi:hypothetical protein Salat_1139400 [Sesamum alatum]|uniref:Uncharacterized protein n=1 Tax=Sesamum alatum TaxID=300844 RepID=A0AAE1YF10_9LAMI|nr:hypothetical protein Salat_1139400 [Sesamum alatum]
MRALHDVNKVHGNVLGYSFTKNKVKDLKERHAIFSWIINLSGVICNHAQRYVVAKDHVWENITRERDLGKCYVNAYENQYAKLDTLFGPDDVRTGLGEVDDEVDSVADLAMVPGWVDESPTSALDNNVLANMNELRGSSNDSTSL